MVVSMKVLFLLLISACLMQGSGAFKIMFHDDWYGDNPPAKADMSNQRSGSATRTHSCDRIRSVPSNLQFVTRYNFYRKYTEAYGIPIISSSRVSDKALKRACYIVRFLLADRNDLRQGVYKNYGRFGVIGINEQTTTIPEFSHLPNWWNTRARGLGGVLGRPISTGGEENVLCLSNDRYRGDDIYFHESAHNVAEVGLAGGLPHMYRRLGRIFQQARSSGKWSRTYAMTDQREYFAEGLQSYHNNHIEGPNPSNGVHGHINTRAELRTYDPLLYKFIKELYPCQNEYVLCTVNPTKTIRMDCDGSKPQPETTRSPPPSKTTRLPPPPIDTTTTTTTKKPTSNCVDRNRHCIAWANYGYCRSNVYVMTNCRKACRKC